MEPTDHALLTDASACTCGAPAPQGDYLTRVEWFTLHFTLTIPRRTR